MLTAAQVPTAGQRRRRHRRARDAPGARTLDQRREPRRGEDLQQGRRCRTCRRSSPGWIGQHGPAELGVQTAPAVVVAQPSFFKALAATVAATPVEQWKPYLKFHAIDRFAPYLSRAARQRAVRLPQPHAAGRRRNCSRAGSARSTTSTTARRRAARQGLRRAALHAGGQGPHGHARREPAGRLPRRHRRASNGWGPRPRRKRTPSWRRSARRSATRRSGATTPRSRSSQDDLVGNMMRALDGRRGCSDLGKVGKPVDPEEWGMTPQTVNAYYNPVRNEIVFPAAILQPPFFDMAADDAVNYGGIGARHRPRDGPRLRRPGPPLRRQGRAARLVDREGRRGVHAPRQGAGGAVLARWKRCPA